MRRYCNHDKDCGIEFCTGGECLDFEPIKLQSIKLQEQYTLETGESVIHQPLNYIKWLEARFALALSRIEAAEVLVVDCNGCDIDYGNHNCNNCTSYKNHQSAIRAMEGK